MTRAVGEEVTPAPGSDPEPGVSSQSPVLGPSFLRHEKLLHVCDRSGRLILNYLTGTCQWDGGDPPQLLSVAECLTHLLGVPRLSHNPVAILKTQLRQNSVAVA